MKGNPAMRGGHCKARNNARDWHKSWVNYNRKRGPMPFDDIPEDYRPSYPCPDCEEGNVTESEIAPRLLGVR